MLEPTVFTDDGIRQWAVEQERYAAQIPGNDPRHSSAVVILAHAGDILIRLACPASSELRQQRTETRRQEILKELCVEWHELKPSTEPPMTELNAKAQRQAYCQARADVMALVQRIIALRKAAAMPIKRRRIRYRPVKRIR